MTIFILVLVVLCKTEAKLIPLNEEKCQSLLDLNWVYVAQLMIIKWGDRTVRHNHC